jgi:prevent-host-death family protein
VKKVGRKSAAHSAIYTFRGDQTSGTVLRKLDDHIWPRCRSGLTAINERSPSPPMAECAFAFSALYGCFIARNRGAEVVQVNILEAKNRLSQLVKAAQAGEDVVIANRGEPVARLVPAGPAPQGKTNAGSARAILDWLKRHKLPAYARRSADEIDAAIDEERNAWN